MCGHHRRAPRHDEHGQASDRSSVVTVAPGERVTDRDRERVVEQLRLHVGQGRVSLEEFEERIDEALEARTGAELVAVLRELPTLRTEAELRNERRSLVTPYLLVSALLVVIWAATGFGFPWPLFPLLGWGLPTLGEWSRLRREQLAATV